MMAFSVENVSVNIGRRRLVSDVSFDANAGSLTAIVGINGIGKSTLLRAFAHIIKPASGRVVVQGFNLAEIRSRKRAQLLSFVGQNEIPPGELTVSEFVALGRLPHRRFWEFGSRSDLDATLSALESLGIADLQNKMCDQLSGGQMRRVVLARAIAQDTGVLLLDEPTNHLDVHHQLNLLEILRHSGRTVIATIHDLDLAMAHFDQVVVLHDGGVLITGTPERALESEILRTAFDVRGFVASIAEAENTHLIVDSI